MQMKGPIFRLARGILLHLCRFFALDEMEASVAKYILHRPLAQKGKPVFFASEIIKKYICYRPDK